MAGTILFATLCGNPYFPTCCPEQQSDKLLGREKQRSQLHSVAIDIAVGALHIDQMAFHIALVCTPHYSKVHFRQTCWITHYFQLGALSSISNATSAKRLIFSYIG